MSKIVNQFETERPIAVMAQMALDRVLDREAIDSLFDRVAEEQYKRNILFSSLTQLMAKVVLSKQPTVHAAYRKMSDEVGASLNALYNKLDRVEPRMSQALVRYSYNELTKVSNCLRTYDNNYFPGLRTKVLDGNHLSGTEHRLKETRDTTAAPLPGKSLVVLDPHREAIRDLFPIEDGHAQERSILDDVITTIERNDLWIADRNFCTLKFLYEIARKAAKFIIRFHGQVGGRDIGRRRFVGHTETGKVYEQDFELPAYGGETLRLRKIEIELTTPTRDGDWTVVIITNLDEDQASAIQVAEAYRNRWTIETAFQRLTEALHCEINTLCYPRAALFAFAIACVAYNAVAIVLAGVRSAHGKAWTDQLSFYYLSLEIAQTHDGMMIAIPESYWEELRKSPVEQYVQELRRIAQHIKLSVYKKTTRGPKKKKPPKKHQKHKVHVSSAKILAQRRT